MTKDWLYTQADFLVATVPESRQDIFSSSNFNFIQRKVTKWANMAIDSVGFYKVRIQLDLLAELEQSSLILVMVGVIFDLVLLTFFCLSVMLLHSLLTLNAEQKSKEFNIMRMMGLDQRSVAKIIALQSVFFVGPANLLAYVVSIPALAIAQRLILGTNSGFVSSSSLPSQEAVTQALLVAILTPLMSSLGPVINSMKEGLSSQVHKSVSQHLSRVDANVVLPKSGFEMASLVVFGVVAVCFGLLIYYFLPQALFSFDYGQLSRIFLLILGAFFFGLCLLSFNAQQLIERVLLRIYMACEPTSLRRLV